MKILEQIIMRKKTIIVVMGVAMLAIILVLLSMLQLISAGHKGVIINSPLGIDSKEINEGWQFSPRYFLADIEKVEWRTQTESFVGSDMAYDELGSLQVITNDSVPIYMDLSVIFHLREDKVADIIIENGLNYKERIIHPYVRSISRDIASKYIALDVFGEKRNVVEQSIAQKITEKLAEKYIIVEGVALRDIRIPKNLEDAIIAKKVAEQNVITQQYNLQAQQYVANQTIINAIAQASAYVINAHGNANATIIKADAQAEAIEKVMKGLNSTNIDNRTKDYLTLLYIQALTDPSSNVRYVVIPSDKGVPIILDISNAKT